MFTSRTSLWTELYCEDADKTLAYLERSRTSPVSLTLYRGSIPPFIRIIPHAIRRLKSLNIYAMPGNLQDITAHLSHPAPLLEKLSIAVICENVQDTNPVLTSALFDGDLSSLHKLRLESLRTELPWRNMTNLTSFTLAYTSTASIRQLLDFFESAPYLRDVGLIVATPTSGTQNGRLVTLAHLKRMKITGGRSSLLLNHLLIPVGVKLTMQVNPVGPLLEDHIPRSLDNLRNFSDFTTIKLYGEGTHSYILFSGPNGQVTTVPPFSADQSRMLLESLAQFDASRTKQLKIDCVFSLTGNSPYQTLLMMKDLRVLTLWLHASTHAFIHALDPDTNSPGVVVCPKLEELVIVLCNETFDAKEVIGMVAARGSRGEKLKSIRIVNRWGFVHGQIDVLQLKKHVSHVEWDPEVDEVASDSDSSDDYDEED